MARKNDRFDLPGQFKCIEITAYTVVISDTCGNVPGSDGRIACLWLPRLRLMGHRIHAGPAESSVHLFDIPLQAGIDCRDIFIFNARNIKGLACSEMEVAVAPGSLDWLKQFSRTFRWHRTSFSQNSSTFSPGPHRSLTALAL